MRLLFFILLFLTFGNVLSCFDPPITCLVEGTPVLTPNGVTPIEKLKVGDEIISYDAEKKKLITNSIIKIKASTAKSTITLLLNNRTSIEGTEEHPFFLPEKNIYVAMKSLKIGNSLLTKNGEKTTIKKISLNRYQKPVQVYDLSVNPPLHNYFAGEVLVHNKSPLPSSININGVCYYEHSLEFYSNDGSVKSGDLCSNTAIDGVSYRTSIIYHTNGNVQEGKLSHAQTINEISYRFSIIYHTNGNVQKGELSHAQTINGVKYASRKIFHYENGDLKQAALAETQTINGTIYGTLTWIRYNSDGSFHSAGDFDEGFN